MSKAPKVAEAHMTPKPRKEREAAHYNRLADEAEYQRMLEAQ